MIWIGESRLDGSQSLKGTNHQTCTYQQYQRHRHLSHHEKVAGVVAVAT